MLTTQCDTNYAYAVARVRFLETRLLDKGRLDRLVDAAAAEDAAKTLSETDYGAGLAELTDIREFEVVLQRELARAVELLLKISPRPEPIRIMTLRYDMHNLKVLFKARYLQTEAEGLLPMGTLPQALLRDAVRDENFVDLPGALRTAAEEVVREFALSHNPQFIDLCLDRYLFEELLSRSRAVGSPLLTGLFMRQIDLINFRTFMRVRRMGLDRGFLEAALLDSGFVEPDRLTALLDEPLDALTVQLAMSDYAELVAEGVRGWQEFGSAARLEKLADDYITDYLRQGRWNAFGLEPLIGYLWAREIEIRNIRLILVGKINKLPVEAIRERMRNAYV